MLPVLSCRSDQGKSIAGGLTEPKLETCLLEPDHLYYVTQPDQLQSGQKVPLIIVIDPHGDGLTAIQKFRSALKDLPIVIAGSNKLRNNYAGFEGSIEHIKNDLLTKYPVDPQQIIVAGFSGGARMALYYGVKNPVHGIIMFGAGPGQAVGGIEKKQIYAVSGTRDFNFGEQYRTLFTGIPNRPNYINDYFTGAHIWPPEPYIREALVFCLGTESDLFQGLSTELSGKFLLQADSLQRDNDLFFAGKALEKAWYFAPGNRQQSLSGKIDAFKSNPEWLAYQRDLETLLNSERRMKSYYAEHLVDPDTTWWSKELSSLFTQIDICSNPLEKDYYHRLKGFLGIYLYSQINALLQKKDSGDLTDRLIRIYEQVEPDSEDLKKFKAERKGVR